MDPLDMFRAYSPRTHGKLEEYLEGHDGANADNLFFGPEYFFVLREKGFLVPELTWVRVDRSPIPDVSYYVNPDLMLESQGPGRENMSCVGARKGVYNPEEVLKDQRWSIYHLRLSRG